MNVIDNRYLSYIPITKGVFASNQFEFEFDNGRLTRYKYATPNELAKFLSIFPKAAKSIVSIPSEILQLKINHSNKEMAYFQAQAMIIAARLQYQEALGGNPPDLPAIAPEE